MSHYVPQEYLRHFAPPSCLHHIWMFDKQSREFKLLPINAVAQSPNFYYDEDEKWLNQHVEIPAHGPLNKLRSAQPLTESERIKVAVYLQVMHNRTLYNRLRTQKTAREVIDDYISQIRADPESEALKLNLTGTELLDEVAKIEDRTFEIANDLAKRQGLYPRPLAAIYSMTWTVIRSATSDRFLTSDNPFFFDEGYGLQEPGGGFCLPLSSEAALYGSWQYASDRLQFVDGPSRMVKEVNRWTAFGSDRFLFFHQDAVWVKQLIRIRGNRLKPMRL